MTMTNSDTLHVETTPMGFTAYYDPEGLHGDGATRALALEDLLEQTDEAWRKALDERDAAKRALSEGMRKWTSLGLARPPEQGRYAIVYRHNATGHRKVFIGDFDGEHFTNNLGDIEVTHWMPLPEIPQ